MDMFLANDVGYHQLLPEDEELSGRDSFFNSMADNNCSHSNSRFRFCLPGQNETEEYKREILGFFKKKP